MLMFRSHEALHYVIFLVCCCLLLPTQLPLTLFLDTFSLPVSLPLIWETKFHTHSKKEVKLMEGNFKR